MWQKHLNLLRSPTSFLDYYLNSLEFWWRILLMLITHHRDKCDSLWANHGNQPVNNLTNLAHKRASTKVRLNSQSDAGESPAHQVQVWLLICPHRVDSVSTEWSWEQGAIRYPLWDDTGANREYPMVKQSLKKRPIWKRGTDNKARLHWRQTAFPLTKCLRTART
jgi:hypothetical protein